MSGHTALPIHPSGSPGKALHDPAGCGAARCFCAEIVQHVGLGVVVFDLEQRAIVLLNDSAQEMLGRIGVAADYASLRAAFVPPGLDLAGLRGAHVAPPLHIHARLISRTLHASPPLAWALVQDVTEKARLESIAEAVEMMNNIGFVFSALRHELGNPVNSLKAALSVLQTNLDRYPRDTVLDYIERMRYEVSRVESLLRSMKSFSMYERQEKRRVELDDFFKAFVRLVQDGAASRGVELEVEPAPGLCARCDPRALQQVMLNVFANAVDAAEGSAEKAVRITAAAQGGLLSIRVTDTGPGVAKEQVAQLFKPFCTTKEHGTGLGLVISRKLLAGMDGTITLESEEGRGATAILTLPLCSEPP